MCGMCGPLHPTWRPPLAVLMTSGVRSPLARPSCHLKIASSARMFHDARAANALPLSPCGIVAKPSGILASPLPLWERVARCEHERATSRVRGSLQTDASKTPHPVLAFGSPPPPPQGERKARFQPPPSPPPPLSAPRGPEPFEIFLCLGRKFHDELARRQLAAECCGLSGPQR